MIATNTYPDQSLLPKIWLVWENSKDGIIFLNCQTGTQTHKTPECLSKNGRNTINYYNKNHKEICVSSGSSLKYAYCKYHNASGLVEFAVVEMSSNRTGGARRWEYAKDGERYFLDKNKQVYAINGDNITSSKSFKAYKNHWTNNFADFIGIILRCWYNDDFMNEFKKFVGDKSVIVGNGRCLSLEYAWHIQMWLKYKSSSRTTGKTQKLLDELINLPHMDLSDVCEKFKTVIIVDNDYYHWKKTIKDIIYFERLNDVWSVLRYIYRATDQKGIESYRVYISENGDCKMTKLNDAEEWVPARNLSDSWGSSCGRIVNFDDMLKCKRLSYIMPILKELPIDKQLQYLVSIIKFPEIEKICKMGYVSVAKNLMCGNTVNANIKNMFGEPNKKAKNIFGEFGLNKHQFDVYMKAYADSDKYHPNCVKGMLTIKHYYGDDISAMDNESFDTLFNCTSVLCSNFWGDIKRIFDDLDVDGRKFLKNIVRLSNKYNASDLTRLYNDAISAYRSLDRASRPEINWIFDSYSDLVRAHDAVVEIKRIRDEERRAYWNASAAERMKKDEEKRKKVDEARKIYEYEDDAYIIRLPNDSNEIIIEGSKQRICIGGYTGRHASGDTNLFFLRKKDNADAPFYAIEMNNNNVIIQIHGFGNKWLGNNPEAIPTVVRWLRKHNIACDQKILTCKSAGYSRSAEYVDMPVVD